MWGTTTAPTGWLLCDGAAVSRTTYADLFAVLSTTFGVGDGSTTFNVPDLKGKVAVGYDSGQTEFDAMAETGGAKTHTLVIGEIPAHNHNLTTNRSTSTSTATYPNMLGGTPYDVSANTNNAGGGGAHNNLQPYIVLTYIIKT